jgi:hypothetical protein
MSAYFDALDTLKSAPSREIRGHRVYGKIYTVDAPSQDHATAQANKIFCGNGWHCWEAKEVSPGRFECFVAKHEDAFALND